MPRPWERASTTPSAHTSRIPLDKRCQESLYGALDEGVANGLALNPFTLIGATTNLGALSEPFRSRFKAARRSGLDENGLWVDDRKILDLLVSNGRPMGIRAIAATLHLDIGTLRSVHEPYLAERRYIVRTPRGREATERARREYGREFVNS